MSKKIIKINQLDQGGLNENDLQVDKRWELYFEGCESPRILDNTQMLHYLTKGTSPPKNIHHFRRWQTTFTSSDKVHTWWGIVYSDPIDHDLLLPDKFYNLIYEGHRKEEEEKTETVLGDRGDISTAISSAINLKPIHKTTSDSELKEIAEGRKNPAYNMTAEEMYAVERKKALLPEKKVVIDE